MHAYIHETSTLDMKGKANYSFRITPDIVALVKDNYQEKFKLSLLNCDFSQTEFYILPDIQCNQSELIAIALVVELTGKRLHMEVSCPG